MERQYLPSCAAATSIGRFWCLPARYVSTRIEDERALWERVGSKFAGGGRSRGTLRPRGSLDGLARGRRRPVLLNGRR
jgi:hypothetical protein